MKTIGELGISKLPWRAVRSSDEMDVSTFVKDGKYIDLNDQYLMESDALLISAAPELYEALRILVDMYEYCRSGCKDCKYYPCDADEERVIEKARAALAKASGEEVGE